MCWRCVNSMHGRQTFWKGMYTPVRYYDAMLFTMDWIYCNIRYIVNNI